MSLLSRYENVKARLSRAEQAAGRPQGSVQLMAVSKRHPASAIRTLLEHGQTVFGESYVQEALEKMQQLQGLPVEWHFIGPVQSNKTRQMADHFAWVHSVDRVKIARRLSEQRPETLPPLQICLQVNISNEASKSGFALEELPAAVEEVKNLPRLQLRGLMAIPQPEADADRQRLPFRQLAEALQTLNARFGLQMDTLSMGMSDDMEAAVAEGATIVRVGTDIFGSRD